MKKPVILIVDDDIAVLEALEMELRPAFEQAFRIEAFDDPHDVLETMSRWSAEQRPLVVAVVDQKMPDLTGVELLQQMRRWSAAESPNGSAFDPAAHLRTILLTGHAGLDSALLAKNTANVDRYLEKPWDGPRLRATATELARAALDSGTYSKFLRLAIVDDPTVLVELFKLRYHVYRTTPLLDSLQIRNADHADVDAYDRKSIILGLFACDGLNQRLIGTLRLVTREDSPQLESIRRAAARLPDAGRFLDRQRGSAFPMAEMFDERQKLESFIDDLEQSGARVVEPGRHAVLAAYRRGGTDRRQIEGTVAFCSANGLDHAIAEIPPLHYRHYVGLGFKEIAGVGRARPPVGFMAIWSSGSRIRPSVKPRVDELRRYLEQTDRSRLCFCHTYPACLNGPYVHGDFRDVDIFCPKLASGLANTDGRVERSGHDETA